MAAPKRSTILGRVKRRAQQLRGAAPTAREPTFTIDELARRAGTTVRNVRAYQDRKLVPPPVRQGRVGLYTPAHLVRLRLIGQLLERGYSLGNIGELVTAWESGRDLEQILGFEAAVAGPLTVEEPAYISAAQLAAKFGRDPGLLRTALEIGLLEREGARFRVPSPRTLAAGIDLVAAGIPAAIALETLRFIRRDLERLAARLVELVVDRLLGGRTSSKLPPPDELRRLAETVWRIRPHASRVVDAELARALETSARTRLGERLDRVLETLRSEQ